MSAFADQIPDAENRSAAFNAACYCIGLDRARLHAALAADPAGKVVQQILEERMPTVFSSNPVFLAASRAHQMAELVRNVEQVLALPAVRERLLQHLPADLAPAATAAKGVFLGYVFHVNGEETGLIEINTNAGGAMLNVLLARAQRACCTEVEAMLPGRDLASGFEAAIVAMFEREWALAGSNRPLRSIAIVDAQPESQYLYPEFLLFKRLFDAHGLQALILDPSELAIRDGRLMGRDLEIDLVYNRLTDFTLEEPQNLAVRRAWAEAAAVVTPNPHVHALYADKRNLAFLSSREQLLAAGASEAQIEVLLRGIPKTEIVSGDNAQRLWQERKSLFFKPASGYGSKATYRGDKITSRAWQEIQAGDSIAQKLIRPGERHIGEAPDQRLKFDIRNYVYDSQVMWLAARLYQGQTTNFRTPGGGFAPVYQVPATPSGVGCRAASGPDACRTA